MLVDHLRIATKRNYARLLLNFAIFCFETEVPIIIDHHLNVQAVCFWMGTRADMMGGANSHKSWSAALTWFCGHVGLRFVNRAPFYQSTRMYQMFHTKMVKVLSTSPKGKHPLHIKYIWYFIVNALRIDPDNLANADYDDLVNATFLVLYWITICRPGIIYRKEMTDPANKDRKILTGICWNHLQIKREHGHRSPFVLKIKFPWYKNQPVPGVPKVVTISSICCGKPKSECMCPTFNAIPLIQEIRRRRESRLSHPEQFRSDRKQLDANQLKGLALNPDNLLLVNKRGTNFGRSHADKLFKRLLKFCRIDKAKANVSLYSIRVGATSMGHHQDIDALKLMRFVKWLVSAKNAPMMHALYVQYTWPQLATVPFEVIHGTLRYGGTPISYLADEPEFFDITKDSVNAAVYIKPRSRKGRRHPR